MALATAQQPRAKQTRANRKPAKKEFSKQCFMVYHYDENDIESHCIHDEAEAIFNANGYQCTRPDKMLIEGNFIEIVAAGIADADVVYVNISAKRANPNVFYELGIAHTLNKWTIVVTEKSNLDKLPADIRGYNVLGYELDRKYEFKATLGHLLTDKAKPGGKDPKTNPISQIISEPNNEMLRTMFENVTNSAKHPLTAVQLEFAPDKKPTGAVVASISSKGNEFYGYDEDCTSLRGATMQTLLDKLRDWMNDEDYRLLEEDQQRIGSCISADKSYIPPAEVPIRFNHRHPNPEYRNKCYYPIWIGVIHNKRRRETQREWNQLASILYIDLSMVPSADRRVSISSTEN